MTKQDTTGCVITERGSLMQVGGGRVFYPLDPRAEEVFIEDIARSLSRIIRFNGHSDFTINVAHHSLNCAFLAWRENEPVDLQYFMLMHDAAEAYIGDMIRPLKIQMPDFMEAEAHVWDAIVEALNIPKVDPEAAKYYDNVACAWEKRDLFKSAMKWTGMPDISGMKLDTIKPRDSLRSERDFLRAYRGLRHGF